MIQQHCLSTKTAELDLSGLMAGVQTRPAHLPFWLFYDDVGSDLFKQITLTPEYYLTRSEKQILQRYGAEIGNACGADRVWFEPGAGCCEKAALLLPQVNASAFVAMDVSSAALQAAVTVLEKQLPTLPIYLVTGDFANDLNQLKSLLPPWPRTVFYPGSSIGNFTPEQACTWLTQLAEVAGAGGQLLLGYDRPKHPALLHAAYNDAAGITAAFHLNVLQHLKRLGVTLSVDDFNHYAFYDEVKQRIEMHLQCRRPTVLQWQQQQAHFQPGESIITEYSYKYDDQTLKQIAASAGWQFVQQWNDEQQWFSLALFQTT